MMFTVRHENEGITSFYEAERVEVVGPSANIGPEGLHLHFGGTSEIPRMKIIHGGIASIMNERGKTIAKFHPTSAGKYKPYEVERK